MTRCLLGVSLSLCLFVATSSAQSSPCSLGDHTEYSRKIKEFTTEPFFSTELVDHLPLSSCVPAPDASLHHIVGAPDVLDRKSTRLNSSHGYISYAVFCLKKKKTT